MKPYTKATLDALLEAKHDGTLSLERAWLTLADLMECTESVLRHCEVYPRPLNRKTIQSWIAGGVLPEAMRVTRNRLYTGGDVFRLAVGVVLSEQGLPLVAIKEFVRFADEQLQQQIEKDPQPFTRHLDLELPFDPSTYFWVVPDAKGSRAMVIEDAHLLELELRSRTMVSGVNYVMIANVVFNVVTEFHHEKLSRFLDVVKAEIKLKRDGQK